MSKQSVRSQKQLSIVIIHIIQTYRFTIYFFFDDDSFDDTYVCRKSLSWVHVHIFDTMLKKSELKFFNSYDRSGMTVMTQSKIQFIKFNHSRNTKVTNGTMGVEKPTFVWLINSIVIDMSFDSQSGYILIDSQSLMGIDGDWWGNCVSIRIVI